MLTEGGPTSTVGLPAAHLMARLPADHSTARSLIPAGTGAMMRQYQVLADDLDAEMLAERATAVEAEGLPAEIAEAAAEEMASESPAE